MAISNYAELQTAVAEWVSREDDDEILARVPDFIRLGEARLYRMLRVAENTATTTAARLASDGASWDLPSDYKEAKRFYVNGKPLARLTEQQFYSKTAMTGAPTHFVRIGNTLQVWPTPADDYTWTLTYYRSFTLSDSATTNAVLTAAPDAYLFGTLVAAEPYLENDQRVVLWESQFTNAIDELNSEAEREAVSGSASISGPAY